MASRDEYYKQYLNDLATQYQGQIDTETQNYNANKTDLTNAYNQNAKTLAGTREQAMRDAYISQQKAMRDVPTALAAQGIRGGMTESTYGNLLKTYQNARGAATSSYNQQFGQLGQTYQSNLTSLGNSYRTNINNINTAKEADAWARAGDSWNAYLQQEAEQRAQEQWELERQQARSSSGGSSGRTKKNTETYIVSQGNAGNGLYNGGLGRVHDSKSTTKEIRSIMSLGNGKQKIIYRDGTVSYR